MIFRREFCEKGDSMYAAAILHDIGIIVEDQFVHEGFCEILQTVEHDGLNLVDVEDSFLGYNHARIGEALGAHWGLPPEFVRSIGHHHGTLNDGASYSRMELTLYVANYLCQAHGIGFDDSRNRNADLYNHCLNMLGLDETSIDIIINDLYTEIALLEQQGLL